MYRYQKVGPRGTFFANWEICANLPKPFDQMLWSSNHTFGCARVAFQLYIYFIEWSSNKLFNDVRSNVNRLNVIQRNVLRGFDQMSLRLNVLSSSKAIWPNVIDSFQLNVFEPNVHSTKRTFNYTTFDETSLDQML